MKAERKLAEEALHDFEHYASEVHDGIDECAEDVADAAGRIIDLVDRLVADRDTALLSPPAQIIWRGIGETGRAYIVERMRAEAERLRSGARPLPPCDTRAACWDAAANALEALGEARP